MSIETQILIEKDRILLEWLGEILSDKSLLESAEFPWWNWCLDAKKEVNGRVAKLNLEGVMLAARREAYVAATTATIIDFPQEESAQSAPIAA